MGIFYFELSDNVSGVGSYETEEDEKNDTTISSKSVEPSPKSVTKQSSEKERDLRYQTDRVEGTR